MPAFLKWTHVLPLAALLVLAVGMMVPLSGMVVVAASAFLAATVFAAVHHAEVVAARVGEPFGTLVLALAVTVIEVSLILSMMLAGGADKAVLPRDIPYATVMLICNGVVGICLLVGGLRHREQSFRIEGSTTGIAALIALAVFTLILPNYTTSSEEGTYTGSQLAFVGVAALLLDLPLVLGLADKVVTLLGLTFLVSAITLGSGKTNMMQGAIHLVLFAAFLFLSLVP